MQKTLFHITPLLRFMYAIQKQSLLLFPLAKKALVVGKFMLQQKVVDNSASSITEN